MSLILEFKRLNCVETIECPELNLVQSFCNLMEIFATKENGLDPKRLDELDDLVKMWFLFWLI